MGRLVVPAVHADITTIHDGILQFGSVDRSAIRCELATELRVEVCAGIIKSGDVAVSSTTLAVRLRIVGIEIITAGKGTVATWNPAHMRLFLRVALHVTLQVLLALEAALATGLLALELNLLDNGRQVFQAQIGAGQLLLGGFAGGLAVGVAAHQTIPVARRHREVILVVIVARETAHGRVRSRSSRVRSDWSGRSVGLEIVQIGRKVRVRR